MFNETSLMNELEIVEGCSNKMKMNPKELKNHNILLNAFSNSSGYMRYIQFTKLMIQVAAQATQVVPPNTMPIQYFNEEETRKDMHMEQS